jgi:nitrogen fixation protein NifQ
MPDPFDDGAFAVAMADRTYTRLIAGADKDRDPFDTHVLACILAIGAEESDRDGIAWTEAIGLPSEQLSALLGRWFPGAAESIADGPVERAGDEDCLLDLLRQAATTPLAAEFLAPMVARRAQRPDHLWQDLGLRARTELSALMMRHFHVLAVRNTKDMKWKKYLYRTICGDAGYVLCSAPSCAECADFDTCFGEETGESFLARARRQAETAA